MTTLLPYLIFPGTCREALIFYARCLGGEIVLLRTYKDSPLNVEDEYAGRVFNSILQTGSMTIMASDDLPEHEVAVGTNFALFLRFTDARKQQTTLAALAENGRVLMPLPDGFGMVEDPFQVRWMLALETDAPTEQPS